MTTTPVRPRPALAPQLVHRPELLRILAITVGALVFGILLVLVRVQWVPLESVDQGLAADLNRVVSGDLTLVRTMGFLSRIGSTAVLT